jgi:hypothetical protein
MMNKTISRLTMVAVASLLATACGFESKSSVLVPTAPSNNVSAGGGSGGTSTSSYVGTWASQTLTTLPSPSECGNLQWNVTSQSASAIAGTFSAVCAGNLTVSGTASGQLNGATIPMTASGTASAPGFPVGCPFSLTGTGHVQGDGSLQIDYSGTTCAGPVKGTETLHHAAP